MSAVVPVVPDDLRVIMCIAFDRRAAVAKVAGFKAALQKCEHVVSCCELTGSFDFMLEAALPDIGAYNEKLDGIKEQLAQLVTRYEANFVCRRFVGVSDCGSECAVWVPCQHGRRRLDCSSIDKVTAEGDYMRVYVGRESWLVHATMRDMLHKLGSGFVQLHRSTLVRRDHIERLIHLGRHWTARLGDGSLQQIAKSHVGEVLRTLGIESSKTGRRSSNQARSDENTGTLRRNAVADLPSR